MPLSVTTGRCCSVYVWPEIILVILTDFKREITEFRYLWVKRDKKKRRKLKKFTFCWVGLRLNREELCNGSNYRAIGITPFLKLFFLPVCKVNISKRLMLKHFFIHVCMSMSSSDSEGRKLCKKVKVDPSSRREGAELLHYKWVTRRSAGRHTLSSHLSAFWNVMSLLQLKKMHHSSLTSGAVCIVPFVVFDFVFFQRWDIPHTVQQTCYI